MDMVFRTLDILDRFYTDTDMVWFFGLIGLFTLVLHSDTVRFFGHLDVLDWFFYGLWIKLNFFCLTS